MSPFDWALQPLKRYADFSGRSPRSEYWWFALFQWVGYIVAIVTLFSAGAMSSGPVGLGTAFWGALIVIGVAAFGLFIPNLAVMVRRLHDQDLSGWFCLLFFVPYVGGLVMIVFMCIRGTEGSNRYGPDPFLEDHLERVFA